ncbi:hypothetical protein PRNP1_012867 [Phytophthora ramorum]
MSASFLEPEGDDLATVAEALAFIDACEGSASPSVNGSTSGSDSGGATSPTTLQSGDNAQLSKPKRKRSSKNPAGYSTRLLHRKKAEMQQLREQALALEAKVEYLRRTKAVGVGALAAHAEQLKDRAQSEWMQVAMLEFQRRQRAEVTNRRLKELLKNHKTVDDALKGIILKPSVLQGMEVVLEKPPSVQGPLAVDNSEVIMAQLEKKVAEMYISSKLLFEPESGELPISCEMNRRFDDQLGNVVEIVTKAPLSCPIEAASNALWKELTTIRTYPDKSYRYMQASKPNSMEKNFDQIIRGKAGATPVNGLQFMRKFEEDDRIVVTRAYTMLLPTDGMQLRGRVWTIFSRSETDPIEASEVRFFVQLYMEVQPGFNARPEDITYLRDSAFETWSSKMRGHSQYMLEMLIEAASGVPSPALLRGVC